ncbi:MAG TPA: phosphomannomutase/phosphoglucomutase [Rhodanobacteraceae bacterium]|jgi:phosphomannomutase/phosphoglucomutase|nr:phosphomannomutase/phosphoglucomutase [Rhodanobacteraceae bacterium]
MGAKDIKKPLAERSPRMVAAIARVQRVLRVLIPLAIGTLLLALGLFFAWQAWLVHNEESGALEADQVRAAAITAIGAELRATLERVQAALAEDEVLDALAQGSQEGREAASAALAKALPDLGEVEFYSPALDEILAGDLAKFGYAKAQMLMQSQSHAAPAPMQVRFEKGKGQRLMMALPVHKGDAIVAFAVVYMPFEQMLHTFHSVSISGARLELRQGDGRGDLVIAGVGSGTGSSLGDLGEPIPASMLRIGKGEPEYFIMGPRNLGTLTTLAALCLLGGMIALWLRRVGLERAMATLRFTPKPAAAEITLAEALRQASSSAAQRAKPSAATRPNKPKDAVEAPVNIDRSIFRAYDIRGVVGETLTPAVARMLGRAIGSEGRDRGLKEIVVGRDGRLSGPDMVSALVEGLRSTGTNVIDLGAVPTPVVYFGCFHLNTGSGVSVTGSHNPPDYNGFKIVLGGETLSEDSIQALYARIAEGRFVDGSGTLQSMDITADYQQRIANDIQVERKLKVVVDCGNGIAGVIAPRVIESINCEVIPLYCEVDGTFPNHHPDPSDMHNLQDLILSVKQMSADIGLAFDGDGDRLGVVTKTGEVIYPDRLLMLFAIDILTRNPGATIIYDVKCTGHLQPLILQHGGSPLMWRTGHSLIKAKMKETDAALAGEMSGHFFFNDANRWYGFDDGIYAAARLLDILGSDPEGRDAQTIFDTLPKGVSTPELKIPMREGEHYRFIENFRQRATFEGARITTIDGVRADWPDGWGLVRASNTTPVLVLRFDADSAQALKRVQDAFRTQLLALDSSLPLPF